MLDEQVYPNTANWQIADGMTVYATDGEKLGTVRNYDPKAGYLDVQKGWLFKRDFYIPLSSVYTVDEEGVTLKLTKGALEDDLYSTPPLSAAPPEPVVLTDGSVIGTGEVRKEPWDDGDRRYGRSDADSLAETPDTADEGRVDWAARPR